MKLAIIAAVAENHVIGINNTLPWHLPADLAHFKKLTLGKPIIMGRKTFESIGKALPGRRNIIITRNSEFKAEGCEIFHSSQQALLALEQCEQEIMVIGGVSLFQEFLPLADQFYLTLIHENFQGDTYFPAWSEEDWKIIQQEDFVADERNPHRYSFIELARKR